MAIQGPLRELGVHDVFQLLDLGRKTGCLRVTSELRQNEGTIWFERGAVVAAAIRSNPHLLGTMLLQAGTVRAEELARAVAMQERGDARRIGDILLAIGALTARQLLHGVRAQVEDVVFTLLGWAEGYFVFEEVDPASIPREVDLRISTESVLLEAARRVDEWSRLQSHVPHLGVVAQLAPASGSEPGSLRLTPLEWRVLASVDGTRDVRAIATLTGEPEFAAARALFGLATAGVIVLHDPAAASAASLAHQDPATLLRQAEEHVRLNDLDAARGLVRAVLAGHPELSAARVALGRLALLESRPAEAQESLREALRVEPEQAQARRLLGVALAASGRLDEAAEAWEAWLALPSRPAGEERRRAHVAGAAAAARVLADMIRNSRD